MGEYVLLDLDEYHLPQYGVTILGCTLYSYVPEDSLEDVSLGLNDFFRIDSWTVEEHTLAHKREVAWLNARVTALSQEHPDRQIIVLTHHSPTVDARTINPGTVGSKISSGFVTDLRNEACWLGERVALWAFGHTHYNFPHWKDEDSGTLVFSNQRGYYFAQASGFAPIRWVRVETDAIVIEEGVNDSPVAKQLEAQQEDGDTDKRGR